MPLISNYIEKNVLKAKSFNKEDISIFSYYNKEFMANTPLVVCSNVLEMSAF